MFCNTASSKLAVLLMAAGSSSRLGQPKQLVEIVEKNKAPLSLLQRQMAMINAICLTHPAKAFCVLGFQSEKLKTHLIDFQPSKQFTLIEHTKWKQGLSSSIAKGVRVIEQEVDAVLILMVDQWQLTSNDLISLINAWQKNPHKIQIANDNGKLSPPVIFPSAYFKELMVLSGDNGAKSVINKNMKHVNFVNMKTAFTDLDTPAQLLALNEFNNLNR